MLVVCLLCKESEIKEKSTPLLFFSFVVYMHTHAGGSIERATLQKAYFENLHWIASKNLEQVPRRKINKTRFGGGERTAKATIR